MHKLLFALLTCTLMVLGKSSIQAQTGTLRIKVVDENNISLPGAYVTLSQTNSKGVSDLYGDLTLL